MQIYSKKIVTFIEEVREAINAVLSNEVKLKVLGERFYEGHYSFPIKIVIFNHRSCLAFFDSEFYELGFHEKLMFCTKEKLLSVIRHELAHYLTFIKFGGHIDPHGVEYRTFCQSLGWGEEVYRATICLDNEEIKSSESVILRKIEKLMALSKSSNCNEAEAALFKSQQLALQYNIDVKYVGGDEEAVVLKRIMKVKRENGKMRSIAIILKTFFVNIVFYRSKDFTCLEILGNAINVEIAEHVASVLDIELDRLWNLAKWKANLKGSVAKNSFFLGIAKGYCEKVEALKKSSSDVTSALLVIEKQLKEAEQLVYKRLGSVKSSAQYCEASANLGKKMGRELNINPAIKAKGSLAIGFKGV